MQIVVTGSRSFIGKRFIAKARRSGIRVIGIDSAAGSGATVGDVDVVTDIRDPALKTTIPANCDAVVHLAAISRDGECRSNPGEALDVNVGGTINLSAACRERNVRQLVFASSEWVYSAASDIASREDDLIDITKIQSEYALTKIVAEQFLALACARDAANVTILRFGIVYGPRPSNWSAVESLYHQARSDAVISVSNVATARRFIHVDDIGDGIVSALGRSGFEIFNLSGSQLVTLGDIIETSSRIHGTAPRVVETNATAYPSIRNPDNSKAAAVLGWRPSIDLDTGMRSLDAGEALHCAPDQLLIR